jgi:outer membrane protein TolC
MSDEVGGRFKTAKTLQVDELAKLYDGLFEQVDSTLKDAKISTSIGVPNATDAIRDVVLWGPNGDPFPPEDLTELDSLQIGQLFTFMHNWANYVQAEATRAKSMLDVQEQRNKIVESALRIYYKEQKSVPAGMIADYINTDSRAVELQVAVEKLRSYYKAVESRYEQLKRSLNNISREQTRRAEELERQLNAEGRAVPTKFTKPTKFTR